MDRQPGLLLATVLIVLILEGCGGTLEVGIERTPTPNLAATATVSALMAENARLAALVAAQVTPTPPPDLGRVAYVQGSDIWYKTLPDGKPQRLTTDGRNREPRWSPSGAWLAFRRERLVVVPVAGACDVPRPREDVCRDLVAVPQKQVWIIEDDGSEARPLNQGLSVEAFAWSPTRDRLAYVTANGELQAIDADGSGLTTLVTTISFPNGVGKVGRIAWSPDGLWIAYEWSVQTADPSQSYQGIWKVAQNGWERVELYRGSTAGKSAAILAGWTTQGKEVVFWQDQARASFPVGGAPLYRVPANPGSPDNGVPDPVGHEPVLVYDDFVAPAPPDTGWGMMNAVAVVAGAGQRTWADKRIAVTMNVSPGGMAAISPTWSPNGKWLAYVAMPEWEGTSLVEPTVQELMQRRIWIADPAGSATGRRLTGAVGYRDERPLWSAGGDYILFARLDARGRASLWLVALDSGVSRQVVDELTPAPDPLGSYGHVDWDSLFDWWRGGSGR